MITDKVLSIASLALGVATAVFLTAAVVQSLRLADEKADHAKSRAEAADAVAKSHIEATQWSRALAARIDRAAEDAHARQQTIDQQAQRIADMQRRIARLSADNGGLRNQLEAYASGGAGDSLAACQTRARGLADLLAEGAGLVAEGSGLVAEVADLARESARAAQLRASELDACLDGWPRNKEAAP